MKHCVRAGVGVEVGNSLHKSKARKLSRTLESCMSGSIHMMETIRSREKNKLSQALFTTKPPHSVQEITHRISYVAERIGVRGKLGPFAIAMQLQYSIVERSQSRPMSNTDK